jgi:S1-C subfamily serine protease
MTRRVSLALVALAAVVVGPATAAPKRAEPFRGVAELSVRLSDGERLVGSGIVLTATGTVLTTNDVIDGASSIYATDADNGRTYTAQVAGYDVGEDVAVLQVEQAANLRTAPIGNSSLVQAGERATAYGSPATRGAPLLRAPGHVLLPQQDFIEENTDGSDGLHLPGLVSSDVPAGPSFTGGPLVGSHGTVIGLNAIGRAQAGVQPTGLQGAIPIDRARAIATTIAAGKSTGSIHVGPTAMLGMTVEPGDLYEGLTTGVTVLSVLPSSALAHAGLIPGDIIQSLAGEQVTSPADLTTILLAKNPGDKIGIEWVGPTGGLHDAQIQLAAGPPQ